VEGAAKSIGGSFAFFRSLDDSSMTEFVQRCAAAGKDRVIKPRRKDFLSFLLIGLL
jgi:hypothetical protein